MRLPSHSSPQRLSALTQSDAERLLTSMGKRRVGCSTVETGRSLDKRWALSRPSDAQRLWGSMRQWAGLDARLLHDDWMICLRPNPFLIDSEMSQSAILKYNPSPEHLLSFTFSCSGLIRRLYRSPATLSFLKTTSVVFEDSLLSLFLFTNEQLQLRSFSPCLTLSLSNSSLT